MQRPGFLLCRNKSCVFVLILKLVFLLFVFVLPSSLNQPFFTPTERSENAHLCAVGVKNKRFSKNNDVLLLSQGWMLRRWFFFFPSGFWMTVQHDRETFSLIFSVLQKHFSTLHLEKHPILFYNNLGWHRSCLQLIIIVVRFDWNDKTERLKPKLKKLKLMWFWRN